MEEKALCKLYGPNIDNHVEILELRANLKKLKLIVIKPKASFFDGLFYVMEKKEFKFDFEEIFINLDPEIDLKQNVFLFHAVINQLFLHCTNLKSLTLRNFRFDDLLGACATLDTQQSLKSIDLQYNNLTTEQFCLLLSSIPCGEVNVANNNLTEERKLALCLSRYENLNIINLNLQKIPFNFALFQTHFIQFSRK